jgi:hypothetical protein
MVAVTSPSLPVEQSIPMTSEVEFVSSETGKNRLWGTQKYRISDKASVSSDELHRPLINTTKPHSTPAYLTSTFVHRDIVNSRLLDAWIQKAIYTLNNWSADSRNVLISTSENYLLALYDDVDARILVASYINVLRFNPDITKAQKLKAAHILKDFQSDGPNRDAVKKVIRQLRSQNISISALTRS